MPIINRICGGDRAPAEEDVARGNWSDQALTEEGVAGEKWGERAWTGEEVAGKRGAAGASPFDQEQGSAATLAQGDQQLGFGLGQLALAHHLVEIGP